MSPGASWLEERAAFDPSGAALEIDGQLLSFAELARRARRTAQGLLGFGLRPGEVVAVLLANGLPFVELLHAADRCGLILLPLNARLTSAEIGFQLRDAGARLLVHGEDPLTDLARDAAGRAGGLGTVSGGAGPQPALACASAGPGEDLPDPPGAEDPLALLYTSGTTGAPKGVQLSHRNFEASARASALHLGTGAADRWLLCMPLFHVGGLSILLRSVILGFTVIVQPRFDAEAVSRSLDEESVSIVSLVPTMLERLLAVRGDHPAPPQLRCVLLGGGPAPASLLERATKLGYPLAPTYGLTEATSQVATRPPGPHSGHPSGGLRPLPGTSLRVVDENGRDLPAGEVGEILVRGPTVMTGYWNRPEAATLALRDGWLHTGDVGILDESGALRVLDRRQDLIVSGGENVYPAEIESVLREHPSVADAGIAGVPDPHFGRRPAAWVVATPGAALDPAELLAFCQQRLARYKIPVHFHLVPELPRNAAGKLQRGCLVE